MKRDDILSGIKAYMSCFLNAANAVPAVLLKRSVEFMTPSRGDRQK